MCGALKEPKNLRNIANIAGGPCHVVTIAVATLKIGFMYIMNVSIDFVYLF